MTFAFRVGHFSVSEGGTSAHKGWCPQYHPDTSTHDVRLELFSLRLSFSAIFGVISSMKRRVFSCARLLATVSSPDVNEAELPFSGIVIPSC